MTASSKHNQETSDDSSLFEQALGRYQAGAPAGEVIEDFWAFTLQQPNQPAGWTCLAWLLLLDNQPLDALRAAKTAVRLNPQNPQARINLSLAMLETGAKGVREHIEMVQRVLVVAPEAAAELEDSIADGLQRKPGWKAMEKVKAWLAA